MRASILLLFFIYSTVFCFTPNFVGEPVDEFSSDERESILERVKSLKEDALLQPRHVHLSRKFELDTMTVTWSTRGYADSQYVEYGNDPSTLDQIIEASTDVLTSRDGETTSKQYIHEVTIFGLTPGQSYYYRCVSFNQTDNETLTSNTYRFRVSLDGVDWAPNLLIFGDLGSTNAVTLPYLQQEIASDTYDAAFHIGDIAYNMNFLGGAVGDEFMALIESMAASIPYQVCVGNHDVDAYTDYNEYKKRFRMPGNFDSLLYSWNLGPIHFIAISTEYYFYNVYLIEQQYHWLKKDLEEANKMRDTVPWIVVYGHTPMYCSNDDGDSCTYVDSPLRIGCQNNLCHGLEKLFYEQGVDLQIYGHEHSYETSYPLYDYVVYNGTNEDPYDNPIAPVHVITGSAGNKWGHDVYNETIAKPNWSRIRSIEYSYSRMRVLNNSHLYWEQIAVPEESEHPNLAEAWLLDSFMLVKHTHGPNPPVPIERY